MAKQIAGLCRLEGTFDQLTFYKMDGQYYVRVKSRLTSERVKTSPEFHRTMYLASLMARASRIGSQIYKALPPGWRQFWMYRSFTGEALLLLKYHRYTDQEAKQLLWKCYVENWEQQKAIDPDNPIFQPREKKIRKRRKYSEESIQRLLHRKDKYGRYKYPEYVKAEKERQEREAREAWAKYCEEREQKRLASHSPLITDHSPFSTWRVSNNGTLQTTGHLRVNDPPFSTSFVLSINLINCSTFQPVNPRASP